MWATDSGLVISEESTRLKEPVAMWQDTTRLHSVDKKSGRLGPAFQEILSSVHYPNPAQTWSAFFAPEPYFAVRADGRVLVGGADGTTIDVFNDCVLERRINFQSTRRAVTDEDINHRIERRVAQWEAKAKRPGFVMPRNYVSDNERRSRKLPHFRYYPIIGRIMIGNTGIVLVQRPDISEGSLDWDGPAGRTTWTVLSPEFELVGNIELPAGFTPSITQANKIAGIVKDAVDVPSVQVYSIGGSQLDRSR